MAVAVRIAVTVVGSISTVPITTVGVVMVHVATVGVIVIDVPAITVVVIDMAAMGVVMIHMPAPIIGVMRKNRGSDDKGCRKNHP